MQEALSEGALKNILEGQDVNGPVVQILGIKKITSTNNVDRYRLLVSDGKHSYSFVMLSAYLASLVTSAQLSEYGIICVKKYATTKINTPTAKERLLLVILELEVFKNGNEIKTKIGNPISLEEIVNGEAVTESHSLESEAENKSIINSQQYYKLTEGALEAISNGKNFENPIIQILACKKVISSTDKLRYRLIISDGKNKYSFVMLPPALAHLVDSGQLPVYTIISIKRYVTAMINTADGERNLILIWDLEILKNGDEIGTEIGNPINFNNSLSVLLQKTVMIK